MLNAEPPVGNINERLEGIVARGPYGALALAGVATAIVFALWFAFYFLVFTPRAVP